MASPSNAQHEEEELQSQKFSPNQDEENEQPQPKQQQPQPDSQSAETRTLETLDPQNPDPLELQTPQDQHQPQKEGLLVLDEEEQDEHELPEKSGMSLSPTRSATLEPLTLPDETISDLNPPSITSPTNLHRRPNKRKKGNRNIWKRKQKIQTLADNLRSIPFIPTKTLDFEKHEELLKRLGLWDFVRIDFDRNIRVDLLAQLIVNYDARKRCSYVNDFRINVTRPHLGRSLKLPALKVEKGSVEEVDLDSDAYSEESISFLDDFVSKWVLLHEDTWMMPLEVLNWTRVIKDGHPEKVDWAGLIWYMVEKELTKGEKLGDCYYASHLQYLIKSQRVELFTEEPKVELEVEAKEEDDGVKGEENALVEEPNVELTLGQDISEQEELKDDEIMDVEECKEEEEQGNWLFDGKNNMGEHFLQHCSLEVSSGLNSYEERKQEEDLNGYEERKQEEDLNGYEERKQEEEEEEGEEEEEEMEERDDGFDIEANDDSLERDGLTGNLLQGMETTQIPFSSQDMFASRDGTYMISSGPSFFSNGSKRSLETEHDIPHLNVSNKKLRTNELWDHKSSDFGMCMEQLQQLISKAKMIYESKEQTYESSHMHQEYLISQLQERQSFLELVQKSKDEELAKKHAEIYRLERELYLMGDLLVGYKKALKETQKAFSEYRQRYPFPEEPLYKDAGPGGVVLSTKELEKQQQKQEEEDRIRRLILERNAKDFEEDCIVKFKIYLDQIAMLDGKLVYVENEVKLLKELSAQRRGQKYQDAVLGDDVNLPNLPSEATESQEVGL